MILLTKKRPKKEHFFELQKYSFFCYSANIFESFFNVCLLILENN